MTYLIENKILNNQLKTKNKSRITVFKYNEKRIFLTLNCILKKKTNNSSKNNECLVQKITLYINIVFK